MCEIFSGLQLSLDLVLSSPFDISGSLLHLVQNLAPIIRDLIGWMCFSPKF